MNASLSYSAYCAGQENAAQAPNQLVAALCAVVAVNHYRLHQHLQRLNPDVILDGADNPRLAPAVAALVLASC